MASSNDIFKRSVCYAVFALLDVNLIHWSLHPKVLQAEKGYQTYTKGTFTFNELVIIGMGCFLTVRILLGSLLLWTDKPRGQIWNL